MKSTIISWAGSIIIQPTCHIPVPCYFCPCVISECVWSRGPQDEPGTMIIPWQRRPDGQNLYRNIVEIGRTIMAWSNQENMKTWKDHLPPLQWYEGSISQSSIRKVQNRRFVPGLPRQHQVFLDEGQEHLACLSWCERSSYLPSFMPMRARPWQQKSKEGSKLLRFSCYRAPLNIS